LKQCCKPKTSSLGCLEQNIGHLPFGIELRSASIF
jgi:hypothetical protein